MALPPKDKAKDPAFCAAPWINLETQPNGDIYPCCYYQGIKEFGNIHDNSTESSDAFKSLKEKFLKGETPELCYKCTNSEKNSGHSPRIGYNKQFEEWYEEFQKASPPYFLVLRLGNVCNFSCRICGPSDSTSWYSDAKKLGKSFEKEIPTERSPYSSPNVQTHLKQLALNARSIVFAGGEPLLHDLQYDILNTLIVNEHTNISLCYITNLSTLNYKEYNPLRMWENFDHLNIKVSLDDIGKRGEYIRKGMDFDKTIRNIQLLANNKIEPTITITVSLFNILNLKNIFEEIINNNIAKIDKIHLNLLYTPLIYSCTVLPHEKKAKAQEEIRKIVNTFKPRKDCELYQKLMMIHELVSNQDHSDLFLGFLAHTKRLDALRGESFNSLFPEFF